MKLLAALAAELAPALTGKRVSRVFSPAPGEIVLVMGAGDGDVRLLLSADPGRAGLYLVPPRMRKDSGLPEGDSPLAGMLEARLAGAALLGIRLPIPGDRVVEFAFSAPWPRKGKGPRLLLEAMGRNSNLLLLDAAGRILASHRTLSPAANPVRPLRLGGPYLPPPASAKASAGFTPPASAKASAFAPPEGGAAADRSAGMVPPVETAWTWRERRSRAASAPARSAGGPGGSADGGHFEAALGRLRESCERTLRHLREEEERCRNHGRVRLKGETILLHLAEIPRGADRVLLPHPSEPGAALEILLDPALSPQRNADRLFDLARRLSRGLDDAAARKQEARASLSEVETALTALAFGDSAPARALLGVEDGPAETAAAQPRGWRGPGRRYEKEGFAILVGRGAADNERVAFEAAGPGDLWLHARDYPGSHVVILAGGRAVPEAVVRHAAALCAGRSGARKDAAVEITVAERRWVKKVKGGKSGLVTVSRSRTVLARRRKEEDWPR